MKLVIIESPYKGRPGEWPFGLGWLGCIVDRVRNVRYARRCLRDSLMRGEAPFASHLLYTQPGVLRDGMSTERQHGIDAGLMWAKRADLVAVYADRGFTHGMQKGLDFHRARNTIVEYRTLRGGTYRVDGKRKAPPMPAPCCGAVPYITLGATCTSCGASADPKLAG